MNLEATLQKVIDDFKNGAGILAEVRDSSLLLSEIFAFLADDPTASAPAALHEMRQAHAAIALIPRSEHLPLLEARLAEAKAKPGSADAWKSLVPVLLSILKVYLHQ